MAKMQYRRLGRSGLKVSLLSFGSWVTFANENQIETAKQAAEALHAAARPGTDAPRGAWVFYHSMHGSTDLGHVGISLGDGTMINDNGGEGVKIMSIARTAHYIGWAAPPLSPAITDWLEPTKD